jgi:transposase
VRRSLDPLEDLVGLDRKLKDLDKRLKTAVAATATTLTDIKGVGTATAAMILGEVGDVRRFPSRHHFASYTAAPIEASSGEVERHRLSRAGNRQLNHALHIVALSNKRNDDRGGAYYATKLAAGKGKKGALRCLIGGLSRSRLEGLGPWLLGERQGTAPLPRRVTASFSSAAPDAPRPGDRR